MSFLNHHKLRFTVLSPVSLGCNESYVPTNYVIDEDALYEFDSDKVVSALSEAEHNKLAALVSQNSAEKVLLDVQRFFHNQREDLIPVSQHSLPVCAGVAALYSKRIGQIAQYENNQKVIINKLEIERTAYNPIRRLPYLTGSGIKGAIRTALLDKVNGGAALQDNELELLKGHPKLKARANDIMQQRLFSYRIRNQTLFELDPMRLIHVSDAHWCSSDLLPSSEILFAVDRKKYPVRVKGQLVKSQAEQANLHPLLECVTALGIPCFAGTLNVHNVASVKQAHNKLPRQHLQWSMASIAKACHQFYLAAFKQEIDILNEREYLDQQWYQGMQRILESKESAFTQGSAFLLRIGRHSGAESITLNGVRYIKIMEKNGHSYGPESKTVWLASEFKNSESNMRPFGWVLVEVDASNDSGEPDADSSASRLKYQDWAEKIRARQHNLQAQQRKKQEAEALRKQEQAQEEAQRLLAQQEYQNYLDSLSLVARAVIEFIDNFPGDNPANELYNQLIAGKWQKPEDQAFVASKIKSLWQHADKWTPDYAGPNKNKQKRASRCQKLKEYLDTTVE